MEEQEVRTPQRADTGGHPYGEGDSILQPTKVRERGNARDFISTEAPRRPPYLEALVDDLADLAARLYLAGKLQVPPASQADHSSAPR